MQEDSSISIFFRQFIACEVEKAHKDEMARAIMNNENFIGQ